MLELMNPVALELSVERRREVAEETMRAARASEVRSRQSASSALAIVGEEGGHRLAPRPKMQTTSDCV